MEIQDNKKLPDADSDIKKSSEIMPDVINQYNKILERRKQRQDYPGNLFANLICILMFLCVFYNIFLVETQKYELNILKIQQEQSAIKEQAELDRVKLQAAQKNKESADLVIFNDDYISVRIDYYNKIK